jgi:trimeric autotransporter adhesin
MLSLSKLTKNFPVNRKVVVVFCLAYFSVHAHLAGQIIVTLAGTNSLGPPEGTPALQASIGPNLVTADPQGNIYYIDVNTLVMKITPQGKVMRFAGNGIRGFSGDGGPAINASVNGPSGIFADRSGNVYLADTANFRIRRIDTNGIITTIAGNGQSGRSPDGTPAVQASIASSYSVAVDSSGNVYFADSGNNRIAKVDGAGILTTAAGSGQGGYSGDNGPATAAKLSFPLSVTVDSNNNIVIADTSNHVIRKVDSTGIIRTIAGTGKPGFGGDGGPATSALLYQPWTVSADTQGNILLIDYANDRVRRIDTKGNIDTVAGNGKVGLGSNNVPAISSPLYYPFSVAAESSGSFLIADFSNNIIRRVSTTGIIVTIAGTGSKVVAPSGSAATAALLAAPSKVTIEPSGNLLIADWNNHLVERVNLSTGTISTVAGIGRPTYTGDNVPAVNSGVNFPQGITTDAAGNIYISDTFNERIRKIDTTGVITTIAGVGSPGYSGDQGPAVNANVNVPQGLRFDPAGDLVFADSNNNAVRMITPKGVIQTIAGNGQAGYNGDNIPASRAQLSAPTDVAFDSAGNLYIADSKNNRIRRISNGIITTVTGTGAGGFSGDGPATASQLNTPAGINFDGNGNLIIADRDNHRIRRLTAAGQLQTIAGDGVERWSGDGSLAVNASLAAPEGVAIDAAGDIFIADSRNDRIRDILAMSPAVSVFPSSLTFTANQGGSVSDVSTVNVAASSFGSLAGVLFTASASQPWISVSPGFGATPARLQISIDPSNLTPKTYNETVTVSAPGANPPSQTIAITVTINPPSPAVLALDTDVINVGVNAGAQPVSRQIRVLNRGGGQPQIAVAATARNGGAWLSISPAAGTASATTPAIVTVTITPGNLAPGAYAGQIVVTSGGAPVGAIPVNLAISAKPGNLLLSSNALNFTSIKGGAAPLSKSIEIVNTGTGSLNWNASGASLTANVPNWLALDSSGGSLDRPQSSISSLHASVNPTGLGLGTYYGRIQVTSDSASNSPQFVTVVLNVVDASTNPGPDISATALVFAGVQGVSPSSQTLMVSNLGAQPLNYSSTRVSEDGDWVANVPDAATIAVGQTVPIVVQPDFTKLGVGSHHGTITLRFSDTTVRTIDVLSIVAPSASTQGSGFALSSRATSPRASSPCASDPAHALALEMTSPPQNFSIPANRAATIQVTVRDCAGHAALNSSVVLAYFNLSSGLPTLPLKNAHDDVWTVDWTPVSTAANVTIQIAATSVGAQLQTLGSTSQSITGNVTARSNAPTANALANAASFVAQSPVAPGAFVTIFGTNLANTTASATAIPLKSSLAGATVTLAGRPLPILYASETQINAQVPYDLPMFSQQQLSVQRDDSLSPQLDFVVGRAQPAIYTATARGTGQGVIVFANTVTYVDSSQPAKAGDFLTIYCNGLGPVQSNVDAGTPVAVATSTIDPATVTIGGVNAQVLYAGLTPGIPGLYQINVQMPTGVTPGNAVPVAITISGQTSPDSVTIAVR